MWPNLRNTHLTNLGTKGNRHVNQQNVNLSNINTVQVSFTGMKLAASGHTSHMKYPKIPWKILKLRVDGERWWGNKRFLSHRDFQKNVIRAETNLTGDFKTAISTNVYALQLSPERKCGEKPG